MHLNVKEQKTADQRMLSHMRLQSIVLSCILLLFIAEGVIVTGEFRAISERLDQIEADVDKLELFDTSDISKAILDLTAFAEEKIEQIDLDSINETVLSLKSAADSLTAVDITSLNNAVSSLKSAADKLKSIDTDAINEAVSALTDAAGKLKDVDIDSVNNLIKTIETASEKLNSVSQKLENISNSITGFFNRG